MSVGLTTWGTPLKAACHTEVHSGLSVHRGLVPGPLQIPILLQQNQKWANGLLAPTSQAGLRELSKLGHSWAETMNKQLWLDLPLTKLVTLWLHMRCPLHLAFFSSYTVLSHSAFQKEGHAPINSGSTDLVAEWPDASCGRFETLQKKKKKAKPP